MIRYFFIMVFAKALLFAPQDIFIQGVPWLIEIMLLFVLFMILWVCVCVRSIRYFWKFPFPAFLGNIISAGPYRNRAQPPSMLIDAMDLSPGMKVVELGCGSGLYTRSVARAIQPGGILYAVDIQQGMLDKMMARMESEEIGNVVPVLADAGGHIPLEDALADAAFSVTVIPEISQPVEALRQVHRLLNEDGIYADAEFLLDPDFPLRRTMEKWARQAGFRKVGFVGGRFRYVLVFEKENSQ